MPPCRLKRRKFWKFEEGYSRRRVMINNNSNNNHHQLDQPVITRITSPPPPIQKTALFACFHFLIFNYFSWGSADPICPYVRTMGWFGVVRDHWSSLAMSPFDRSHTTSYWTLIETLCVYRLYLVLTNKISSKQPKSYLLLTFRPLSEAFITVASFRGGGTGGPQTPPKDCEV